MQISRRQLSALGLATLAFAGFARHGSTAAAGDTYRNQVPGYGPLVRDRHGVLDLPAGFSYQVISRAGEVMDDGFITPDKFDGMGCFALGDRRIALVRNHELKPEDRDLGPTGGLARLERQLAQQRFFDAVKQGHVLPGGTSTLVYNPASGRRERQHLSLSGTAVNCAGGVTPWGSWLSCEESVVQPDAVGREHGWLFEVPARQVGIADPRPLTAMGRFRHEAAAVDPATGIVYLTEDRDDGLFYRFLPAAPGELARGGRLQALGLRDAPRGADTRNWAQTLLEPGRPAEVMWIDLDEVESPRDDLRQRGHAAGAAVFARGEGIHFGAGELYFTCTSGGAAKLGQIMRYVPSPSEGRAGEAAAPGVLHLFVESGDAMVMNYADNLTVTPWGHMLACEDRADGGANHLKGIAPDGRIYTFARLLADTELAGACFSPDGSLLFVNVYRPGQTLAIAGPWGKLRTA